MRQLTSQSGQVTYAKSYDPYGVVTQSSGASQSAYGYTGEQQSNDMVYLRARYYSPLEGRFLSRDPSNLERNLFSYVSGNPVNRIDPTGLFSPSTIAKSYGFNSFEDLLNSFGKEQDPYFGQRWGWLALLLNAKPGDEFTASYPNIVQLYPSFSIHHKGILNTDNNGKLLANINGSNLDMWSFSYLQNKGNSKISSRLSGQEIPFWRDASPHAYNSRGVLYTDYAQVQNDFPDMHAVTGFLPSVELSLGLGVGTALTVDRFGNIYASGSIGSGIAVGVGQYSESYFYDYGTHQYHPSESEILNMAFCATVTGNGLGGGITGGFCPVNGFVLGIVTYNLGMVGGISDEWTVSKYLKTDRAMGWNWASTYRNTGITRSEVERRALLQSGSCP